MSGGGWTLEHSRHVTLCAERKWTDLSLLKAELRVPSILYGTKNSRFREGLLDDDDEVHPAIRWGLIACAASHARIDAYGEVQADRARRWS
jgi:hypothetical protein